MDKSGTRKESRQERGTHFLESIDKLEQVKIWKELEQGRGTHPLKSIGRWKF
jgi:hypothetical protein